MSTENEIRISDRALADAESRFASFSHELEDGARRVRSVSGFFVLLLLALLAFCALRLWPNTH